MKCEHLLELKWSPYFWLAFLCLFSLGCNEEDFVTKSFWGEACRQIEYSVNFFFWVTGKKKVAIVVVFFFFNSTSNFPTSFNIILRAPTALVPTYSFILPPHVWLGLQMKILKQSEKWMIGLVGGLQVQTNKQTSKTHHIPISHFFLLSALAYSEGFLFLCRSHWRAPVIFNN